MRGGGRIGGKTFKVPRDTGGGKSYDPFEMIDLIGDLPVAPRLEPINDNFSWSVGADPADPRDCARYPASPYCGEIPFRPGSPFGVTPEIRTNGCETCIYIYPVILWLMATPQVICYRDPNCDRKQKPPAPFDSEIPDDLDENVQPDRYTSPECAQALSDIHRGINRYNRDQRIREKIYQNTIRLAPQGTIGEKMSGQFNGANSAVGRIVFTYVLRFNFSGIEYGGFKYEGDVPMFDPDFRLGVGVPAGLGFTFATLKRGGNACPPPPQILPPPPVDDGSDEDKKRKERGGKEMCCNECKDASDNTAVLLREIKAIKKALGTGQFEKAVNAAVGIGDGSVTAIVNTIAKRLGTNSYPIEVPESLLTGTGTGKVYKAESNAEYLFWLTKQIDALVGEFPIDIEIKDIDPIREGDQKKVIQLPNIAEAIAEIYGLTMKSSVNQEVELNMLLRLAAETIATKNAAIVTQDYARANATFLGYKGNYKPRELQYTFDFANANLDPRSKEPIVLEKLLKTVKGYVQGWQIEDKETVVGFLQKLMFSAGIIKAVFFRGKNQQKELNRELTSMNNDEKAQEKKFEAFIKEMNDPESRFNKDSQDKPIIRDITPPSTGAQ